MDKRNYEDIPDFGSVKTELSHIGEDEKKLFPSKREVISITNAVLYELFGSYFLPESGESESSLSELYMRIKHQIELAAGFTENRNISVKLEAESLIRELPKIKAMLLKDRDALFEGDPAAMCREEIILSYPGFFAISIYRIAHEFYKRGIPLIPRLMTEYAHYKTGIDIHAGASIGEYFFIDHGTGTVIGETTNIGNRVKIYQGVTLGAKSFELDEKGNPVKGVKRHPDIGNNVIIYANATILGGNTRIGDGAVIGGNVWLTASVPDGAIVYYNK